MSVGLPRTFAEQQCVGRLSCTHILRQRLVARRRLVAPQKHPVTLRDTLDWQHYCVCWTDCTGPQYFCLLPWTAVARVPSTGTNTVDVGYVHKQAKPELYTEAPRCRRGRAQRVAHAVQCRLSQAPSWLPFRTGWGMSALQPETMMQWSSSCMTAGCHCNWSSHCMTRTGCQGVHRDVLALGWLLLAAVGCCRTGNHRCSGQQKQLKLKLCGLQQLGMTHHPCLPSA